MTIQALFKTRFDPVAQVAILGIGLLCFEGWHNQYRIVAMTRMPPKNEMEHCLELSLDIFL